jgi:UPF0716 family protein affecting phage T7 exclusion
MKRPDRAGIWAWVALVAAAGVLTTLAILLVSDVVALLLVLAALGLAGAGLWIATTRRGVARFCGLAVAIVALAGGVVALVWQGLFDELIALVIALAAFGAASRMALRRRQEGRTGSAEPRTRSSRARSAVLLINPKSGGGKAERFDLAREARKRGIAAVVLARGDDLLELAEQAYRSRSAVARNSCTSPCRRSCRACPCRTDKACAPASRRGPVRDWSTPSRRWVPVRARRCSPRDEAEGKRGPRTSRALPRSGRDLGGAPRRGQRNGSSSWLLSQENCVERNGGACGGLSSSPLAPNCDSG